MDKDNHWDTLAIGKEVWWSDPEGIYSGVYEILEIHTDPREDNALYDDTLVTISNGFSKRVVGAGCLRVLRSSR